MANFIINRVKALFYIFVGLFKRALCCFKRRRRPSCEPIPLTNVGVMPNIDKQNEMQTWNAWEDCPTVVTDNAHKHKNEVQQQIEMYRQQRLQSMDEEEKEQVNFFEDMTPRITRQTKILLQEKNDAAKWSTSSSSSLSLAHDPVYNAQVNPYIVVVPTSETLHTPTSLGGESLTKLGSPIGESSTMLEFWKAELYMTMTSELGVWEDSPGWEDQTQEDWDTNSVLREKRRIDRERKLAEQQRRKLDREFRSGKQLIGSRIS